MGYMLTGKDMRFYVMLTLGFAWISVAIFLGVRFEEWLLALLGTSVKYDSDHLVRNMLIGLLASPAALFLSKRALHGTDPCNASAEVD